MPQSPRARRQPSLTQAAIQGLIDNPPVRNPADPAFMGRDWRQIAIGELVKPQDLRFVEVDTGIEEATNVRIALARRFDEKHFDFDNTKLRFWSLDSR